MSEAAGHKYQDIFFGYVERARAGRRRMSSFSFAGICMCRTGGYWVRTWRVVDEWGRNGVEDALGVDGDYVSDDRLVITKERFAAFDLQNQIPLGRRFDLVQNLEISEQISASKAEIFIDTLVAHGDVILFSGAVPGWGGELHIN